MKSIYIITFSVMVIATLVITAVMLATPPRELTAQYDSQQTAPQFSLPDLNGVERSSSEWAGKIIVVNFWASWCPPCVREIPGFIRLQEKYEQQVQFVGIALDQTAPVKHFANRMAMNYPVLLAEREGSDLSKKYGNQRGGLPFTAVVNQNGVVVTQHLGELAESSLETLIQQLITKEATQTVQVHKVKAGS